jgi:hypothetical protein
VIRVEGHQFRQSTSVGLNENMPNKISHPLGRLGILLMAPVRKSHRHTMRPGGAWSAGEGLVREECGRHYLPFKSPMVVDQHPPFSWLAFYTRQLVVLPTSGIVHSNPHFECALPRHCGSDIGYEKPIVTRYSFGVPIEGEFSRTTARNLHVHVTVPRDCRDESRDPAYAPWIKGARWDEMWRLRFVG